MKAKWEIGPCEYNEDGNELVHIQSAETDAEYEDRSGRFKSHVATVDGREFAALVAAAPDLYKALNFLIDTIEKDRPDAMDDAIYRAIKALAKARGES